MTSEAGADALAAVLGEGGDGAAVVRSDASASLPGCTGCRAESAIDGDLATAWQTPFDDVRNQHVDYDLPAPVTFDHMDLAVVADGRHSVPTRIRLEVDGEVRDLTLPPIADQTGENATAMVPLAFAPVTGSHVRVTIVDVREAITFNYYAQTSSLLPAGIAELGIPGLHAPVPAAGGSWASAAPTSCASTTCPYRCGSPDTTAAAVAPPTIERRVL